MKTTLYVICPDVNVPSGGIKKLHDHVTTLNELGYDAFIVYQQPDFRCDWFDNRARTTCLNEMQVNPQDILVVPEIFGVHLISQYPGVKKVIYCQNTYYSVWGLEGTPYVLRDVYCHPDVVQVIVNSEQDRQFFSYLFPGLKVFRVHNGIDPEYFGYVAEKKPQIAYIPNKLPKEALLLRQVLQEKGVTEGFEFRCIETADFQSYSGLLRESLLFLSFSYNEGFGLPPAEAMACGCLVVGYHGTGGKEYFTPEVAFPVAFNDLLLFARTVEDVLRRHRAGDRELTRLRQGASRYVLQRYPLRREKTDVAECWDSLFCAHDLAKHG
jgi:glycosyltransferase involved in cell wall biosynthesis